MILKFPDLDTLKLVLISGAVPPSVSLAPANAGFDEQGQLWLEPSVTPRPKAQDDLKKYGVQSGKKSGAELSAEISCWLEMLPLVRESGAVAPPEQTPVLFGLSSGEQFTRLATEIMRLGNDRQSYRWLDENGGPTRALLRVVGPPYYSLLRALDAQGPDAPVAFAERAARVWVELGYQHPLEGSIKPPPGQILLLRPPCMWTYLPEQPFREIYEVLEFELPGKPLEYEDGELEERLKVPLRLARGGGNEVPELWVLRNNPIAELNNLVQNSDDQLLGRLAFAAGGAEGRQTIILRVRPSKLPPPVLVLEAIGFRPFLKLPNLYLPAGQRLHPPLRRDVVRQKLAADANVLTWLYPEGKDGGFAPESISQDAFRPLTEWVDYIIDRERAALTAWVQSNSFDFEPFICDEEGPPRPKKAPPPERGSRGGKGGSVQEIEVASPRDKGDKEFKTHDLDDILSLVPAEPSAQQLRLRELEEQFIAFEGPLDTPERTAMWPEMASLHSALKQPDDAGICWRNALWLSDDWPDSWVWNWFQNEASAVPPRQESSRSKPAAWTAHVLQPGRPRDIPGEDLDKVLNLPKPTPADVRALAAYVVWASRRTPPPADLMKRLNAVGQFLEAHDALLAVRATWLAWMAFAQLTNGDVLALARTRDRLLERLFQNGLRPEHDLPTFLRFAGQPASRRFQGLRQWMLGLCKQACTWSRESGDSFYSSPEAAANTLAYIQLLFAYGLARLGELDASNDLAEQAQKALKNGDAVHQLLLQSFVFRMRIAQENKKNSGPLQEEIVAGIAKLQPMESYVIDRLRQHSQILEPDQKLEPYLRWAVGTDDLGKKLREAMLMTDVRKQGDTLLALLKETPQSKKQGVADRIRVLRQCLETAPRLGEEFAVNALTQLLGAWDAIAPTGTVQDLTPRVEVMVPALFAAAHFDRKDHVHALVTRVLKLLKSHRETVLALNDIDRVFGESLRGLRKLGMRDEIDLLLHGMAEAVLGGQELSAVSAVQPDARGMQTLRSMLHLASGWLYFGREREAEKIVSAARRILFDEPPRQEQMLAFFKLARVYVQTISGVAIEVLKRSLEELYQRLPKLRDSRSTGRHFTLMHLDLSEAAVMAVAGEDSSIGGDARRWLDDDEYIVRRRIHSDFHLENRQKDREI